MREREAIDRTITRLLNYCNDIIIIFILCNVKFVQKFLHLTSNYRDMLEKSQADTVIPVIFLHIIMFTWLKLHTFWIIINIEKHGKFKLCKAKDVKHTLV